MYEDVLEALLGVGTTAPSYMETLAENVSTAFTSALGVAVPVVGGIAIGYFAIRVVRGLIHA